MIKRKNSHDAFTDDDESAECWYEEELTERMYRQEKLMEKLRGWYYCTVISPSLRSDRELKAKTA